jgi:hypothetical protein
VSTDENELLRRRAERLTFHVETPLGQPEILKTDMQRRSESAEARAKDRHLRFVNSAMIRPEGRGPDAGQDSSQAKLP